MDQSGSPTKTVSQKLKEMADMKRVQLAAEAVAAEAKRRGLPPPPSQENIIAQQVKPSQEVIAVSSASDEIDENLLTSSQAARLLGYAEKSFRNSVALGKIPYYRLFGRNRFKKSELLGLLVRVEKK